jgi:hypothetical protein
VTLCSSTLTKVLTMTPYYMITNAGVRDISVRDELPADVQADAGWLAAGMAKFRRSENDLDVEKQEIDVKWYTVAPGKVLPYWPHPKNRMLQLVAK